MGIESELPGASRLVLGMFLLCCGLERGRPAVIPRGVLSKPQDEVPDTDAVRKPQTRRKGDSQVLWHMIYIEQPFLEVLETKRRKMLAVKDILERDLVVRLYV